MRPRILIVEDETIVSMDIKRTVEKLGYAVAGTASTGEEAMMKVTQLRPDVILMDIILKGKYDGIETANKIKKLLPTPVIFLTAFFDDEMLKRASITEPFGYIFKPFEEKELQIALEITLYKTKIEQRLRESEKQLKYAASLSHLGNWERDLRTNETTWSDEHYRIFGLSPNEAKITFERFIQQVHPQDKEGLVKIIKNALEKQIPYTCEYRIILPDGQLRWVHVQASVMHDEMDVAIKLAGTTQDITDRKIIEQSLTEAKELAEQAIKLKDQFVSLVAHDLRAPLSVVSGFLKIIKDNLGRGNVEEVRGFVELIIQNTENMARLIDDVLNINKLRSGKISLKKVFMDAYSVVEQAFANLGPIASKKGLALKNEVRPKTRIYADQVLYYEVVQNLLTNAIKFSKPGGTITVFTQHDNPATLSVSDDGVGVPPESIETIFSLEHKTATTGTAGEKGTGYGLPLSLDIMKAHGGAITVESAVGKGSVFHASLPLVKPLVLLVDDDPLSRSIYKEYLQPLNVEVKEAENGAEALELLNTFAFHLVIADVFMPVMDGFQLLKEMRGNHKFDAIPLLAITAKPDLETGEKVFRLGGNDFISKKGDGYDFIARVGRFLV